LRSRTGVPDRKGKITKVVLGFAALVVLAMLTYTATAQLTFIYAYDKYTKAVPGTQPIKASGNFYAEIDRVDNEDQHRIYEHEYHFWDPSPFRRANFEVGYRNDSGYTYAYIWVYEDLDGDGTREYQYYELFPEIGLPFGYMIELLPDGRVHYVFFDYGDEDRVEGYYQFKTIDGDDGYICEIYITTEMWWDGTAELLSHVKSNINQITLRDGTEGKPADFFEYTTEVDNNPCYVVSEFDEYGNIVADHVIWP